MDEDKPEYYTPRRIPWKPIKGYEEIDPYEPPPNVLTSQTRKPCYVPKCMTTAPLKFPSLLIGYEHNPLYVSRVALSHRYPCEQWFVNHKELQDQVRQLLGDHKTKTIDNFVKKERARRIEEAFAHDNKDILFNSYAKILKAEWEVLEKILDDLVEENRKVQDFERRVNVFIKYIEAPLQISEECLNLREARPKRDLVNDEVENCLMFEVECFKHCAGCLKDHLETCKNQLIHGRKIQGELENYIKTVQWAVLVNRIEEEIKNAAESQPRKEKAKCLEKEATKAIRNARCNIRVIEADMREKGEEILRAWNNTNAAFKKRRAEMKEVDQDNQRNLFKIKNEINSVDKNLRYLKRLKDEDLVITIEEGFKHAKSLRQTKDNLKKDLAAKLNSMFIDEHKCMSMRRCFPISLATDP